MTRHHSIRLLFIAFIAGGSACSTRGVEGHFGSGGVAEDPQATGGNAAPSVAEPDVVEPSASTGGFGGAQSETGEEITHPLFGAGNYPSTAPTDPCIAAQRWEDSTTLDLTTGAQVLLDGVVYEVTGVGKSEATWADEWTAPPCTRDDGHCEDLAYRVVATCD